jgi:serine/threonine protein kinase/Tol biopolymer transport system component
MIGKTLVHYEITAEIGKGGMGEVYQAKDMKLGRDVAIKVLPEEFALDTDRVARFQRKAKLLASLNHPNIAAIYGLEESEGIHFLVMELIEGETLKDRIKSSHIPVEDALKLSLQMAEALEAAHEKGVIHRDLKPANIKVTPDGKVKILDFGLAKAYAGDQENVNLADSPTISAAATQQGVILGTAAYMSPEQAKGKSVDKRADIWAFGVVFFEMLTGRQLFTGETASETLASVMKSEPEWDSLPPNLHSRIRLLLERCLEKQPKDRYSGISDARVDIQKVLADPSGLFVQTVTTAKPRKKRQFGIPWLSAALVLGGIIVGMAVWYLKPLEARRVVRFEYHPPENQKYNSYQSGNAPLAVSPEGSHFVYGTPNGLYIRSVDHLDSRHIAGTDGNSVQVFFSPDGDWLGYWDKEEKELKKVAISGGAPVALCDTEYILIPSWNADDTIIYGSFGRGLMRVSADGGTPETLIEVEGDLLYDPQILPQGKSVLYGLYQNNISKIVVKSLESGETKELFEGEYPCYLPTGHLVYRLAGDLFAVPFKPETGEVKGGPVSIVKGVGSFSISDEGTLVYIPSRSGTTEAKSTLVWIDREGKEEKLSAQSGDYRTLSISPDGTRLALEYNSGGNYDIWTWDLVREIMTRLTFDEAAESDPLWTLDGQRIVFWSSREGGGIYWKEADVTGEAEHLISIPDRTTWPLSWSRDGKALILEEADRINTTRDIAMLLMEDDRKRIALLQEKYNEQYPQISPDGQWLAYQSDESGKNEIYVRTYPDVNKRRWQVSTSGGKGPRWSPDGRELYYLNGSAVMAVSVDIKPTFDPGKPEILFQGTNFLSSVTGWVWWDIHPNGKKFLMIKPTDITGEASEAANLQPKIVVVLNWFEELKQRVPVD